MRAQVIFAILTAVLSAAWPAAATAGDDRAVQKIQRHVLVQSGSGSWMGVGVTDVTAEKTAALKLKEERGVEIVTVSPDSPAQQAGLKEKDVVLEFNGARVEGVEQFRRLIRETPAGRTVKLLLSRDGAQQTVNVKLGERRRSMRLPEEGHGLITIPPIPPIPPLPEIHPEIRIFTRTGQLGIDGEELTRQLGEFFGVPGNKGVLVRSVNAGSPAEKAGFKAGDVIIKVETESIEDMGDLRSALRERSRKGSFPITVIRNKKEMTLTVNLERPETGGERI